jgi:nucleotide-binding universal stress UspA family protein
MRKIVVGIDGSESAAAALRWAAQEAQLHGASLTAVMAWTLLGQPADAFTPTYGFDEAIGTARDHVRRAAIPVEADVVAPCDLPAAALVDACADADLVVVGSRGRGGFRSLLLGSVSAAVAERAPCAVCVVRGTGHVAGPVVVGVDGSVQSERSLRWAVDEARLRGVSLELVHAWEGASAPAFGLPAVVPLPHAEEAAEHRLTEVMRELDLQGVVVHRHLAEGSPAGVLVDWSEIASVVVVGSRGRGGLASVLLGSTSRHLLHHASCPVVVVR